MNAKELILKKINADTNWVDIYTSAFILGENLNTVGNFMINPEITELISNYSSSIFDPDASFETKIQFIEKSINNATTPNQVSLYTELLERVKIAEELRILGKILKINQGMPTNTADFYEYVSKIEYFIESKLNSKNISEALSFSKSQKQFTETSNLFIDFLDIVQKILNYDITEKSIEKNKNKINSFIKAAKLHPDNLKILRDYYQKSKGHLDKDDSEYQKLPKQIQDVLNTNVDENGKLDFKNCTDFVNSLNAIYEIMTLPGKNIDDGHKQIFEKLKSDFWGFVQKCFDSESSYFSWVDTTEKSNREISNELWEKLQQSWKKFDLIYFIRNEEYAQSMISEYESVKEKFNILDTLKSLPHFNKMYEVLALNDRVLTVLSKRNKIESEVWRNAIHKNNKGRASALMTVPNISERKILKSLVDDALINTWLTTSLTDVYLEAGGTRIDFDGSLNVQKLKSFIENSIISRLRRNMFKVNGKTIDTRSNEFVRRLSPGKNKGESIFKLSFNMSEIDSNPGIKQEYEKVLKAFGELKNIRLEGGLTVVDVFYLYNLIVHKDHFGRNSLTRLFEDLISAEGGEQLLVFKFNEWLETVNEEEIINKVLGNWGAVHSNDNIRNSNTSSSSLVITPKFDADKTVETTPKSESKTVKYTPKGQPEQTYTIIGNKIFNSKGAEVYADANNGHRQLIFVELALQEKRAVKVEYRNVTYVVNDRNQIFSTSSNKIVYQNENDGNRRLILEKAKEEFAKLSNQSSQKVEIYQGYWTRKEVESQTDKVFLFGDNTDDRINTHYVPTRTQAVIRGLPNAIGIDTKKNRGTSENSYFTDADFDIFKAQVDEAIQRAIDSGKTIVIPADGIGTGKAELDKRAPKLFAYLQQKLDELKSLSSSSPVQLTLNFGENNDPERFNTAEESIAVLESPKTILSNSELQLWSHVTNPKILVASEHSDPAFHTKKILEVINGTRNVTDWKGDNFTGNQFDGLYIITKHDGLPIRKLLETKIPKLIHFSITTLGGTKYEPGVMKYNDLLDRIAEYIKLGLDPNTITIRIDPIVPGETKWEDIETVMRRSAEMGIKRIKFSIMDAYPNTIKAMTELGYSFETYYETKTNFTVNGQYRFHAKADVQKDFATRMLQLAQKYNLELHTCAEPLVLPGILHEGCLSVNAVNEMLGTHIEDKGYDNNKSRQLCSCFGGKIDVLKYGDHCSSHCIYCYAKHENDRAMQYYNEDGTLKRNAFTDIYWDDQYNIEDISEESVTEEPVTIGFDNTDKRIDNEIDEVPSTINIAYKKIEIISKDAIETAWMNKNLYEYVGFEDLYDALYFSLSDSGNKHYESGYSIIDKLLEMARKYPNHPISKTILNSITLKEIPINEDSLTTLHIDSDAPFYIESDEEYTSYLLENELSREKADIFIHNFVTKILNVSPKYKATLNANGLLRAYQTKQGIIGQSINKVSKKIFGYDVDLDDRSREKFIESLNRELSNWVANLSERVNNASEQLSSVYQQIYKQRDAIRLLQVYIHSNLNLDLFTETEKDTINEILRYHSKTDSKKSIGYIIQKEKAKLKSLEAQLPSINYRIHAIKLAAKNRLLAMNLLPNLKELVKTRLLAEYDSYTFSEKDYNTWIKPYESLAKAVDDILNNPSNEGVLNLNIGEISFGDLVNKIKNIYPEYTDLLDLIQTVNPTLKIEIVETLGYENGGEVGGKFKPSENKVLLLPNKSIIVAIHELIHAASYYGLVGHSEGNAAFEEKVMEFIKYIREYCDNAKIGSPFKSDILWGTEFPASIYGMTNASEFIAETMSNPQFQQVLDQIPAMKPKKFNSLLEEVVDGIIGWFKRLFRKPKKVTALTQARKLALAAMRIQQDHFEEIEKQLRNRKNKSQNHLISAKDYSMSAMEYEEISENISEMEYAAYEHMKDILNGNSLKVVDKTQRTRVLTWLSLNYPDIATERMKIALNSGTNDYFVNLDNSEKNRIAKQYAREFVRINSTYSPVQTIDPYITSHKNNDDIEDAFIVAETFDVFHINQEYIAEREEILRNAPRNAEGKLLAPHGEVSKLNEEQWVTVRTKAFKEWFGDWTKITKNEDGTWNIPDDVSKVIDTETGEPKVVYHHTDNPNLTEFSTDFPNYFSQSKGGTKKAIFFDENPSGTLDRKYDIPVFLNIRNLTTYVGTKEDLHKKGTDYTTVVNESAARDARFGGLHMSKFDDNKLLNQDVWIIHDEHNVKSATGAHEFTSSPNIYDADPTPVYQTTPSKQSKLIEVVRQANEKGIKGLHAVYQSDLVNEDIYIRSANGFVRNGEIYINVDRAGDDTVIHEFGHLYLADAKIHNREKYYALLDKVRQTALWANMKSWKAYANKIGSDFDEEVLATMIGDYYKSEFGTDYEYTDLVKEALSLVDGGFIDLINSEILPDLGDTFITNYALSQKTATLKSKLVSDNILKENCL